MYNVNASVALKNMKNSIFYIFPYLYFDILLLQSFGAFQASALDASKTTEAVIACWWTLDSHIRIRAGHPM